MNLLITGGLYKLYELIDLYKACLQDVPEQELGDHGVPFSERVP